MNAKRLKRPLLKDRFAIYSRVPALSDALLELDHQCIGIRARHSRNTTTTPFPQPARRDPHHRNWPPAGL